jgi:hypothetical protein
VVKALFETLFEVHEELQILGGIGDVAEYAYRFVPVKLALMSPAAFNMLCFR